jgi:hypothetical protein
MFSCENHRFISALSGKDEVVTLKAQKNGNKRITFHPIEMICGTSRVFPLSIVPQVLFQFGAAAHSNHRHQSTYIRPAQFGTKQSELNIDSYEAGITEFF